MVTKVSEFPAYYKPVILLVGLIALTTILYVGQEIIVPLVFAIIIAILLNPVVKFFVRKKINRVLAITITLILSFLVIVSFGMLLISQISQFNDSWPLLVDRCTELLNQSISGASQYFDIDKQLILDWVAKTKSELINTGGANVGQTLLTVGNEMANLLLIPFYIFVILYYESLLRYFIYRIFASSEKKQVSEIVSQTKTVIQQYLIGLVIEFLIVSTLNTIVLLALGIQYAILLGIIGGLLNLIPYIGGLVAVALPMMVAIATKTNGWYPIYVLVLYYLVQLFDNNYIVPIIVASKVKINALFSVIVVLAGNALWGVSGMFLSIPLLAIVKVICDHIESLQHWGMLFGEMIPIPIRIKKLTRKLKPIHHD
ncbi:MAG: AI-2E family transporter [Bacteroidales bacterium]|nr:AI-2E family transporter [Bacteroidales bacterium]